MVVEVIPVMIVIQKAEGTDGGLDVGIGDDERKGKGSEACIGSDGSRECTGSGEEGGDTPGVMWA